MPKRPPTEGYTCESSSTGWFVGIIVALALLAIGYLVFSANSAASAFTTSSPDVKVLLRGGNDHGSGTHIGGGLILTAEHVVVGQTSMTVRTQGGIETPAEILWSNEKYDVALIRVGDYSSIGVAALNCSVPDVGSVITTFGNPQDLEFVLATGRVAGTARQIGPWPESIPVDIALAGGNSGGGVYDRDGRIVGILVGSQLDKRSGGPTGFGVIVATPIICTLLGRT